MSQRSVFHCNQYGVPFQKLCDFCDNVIVSPDNKAMYFVASSALLNRSDNEFQIWRMDLQHNFNSFYTQITFFDRDHKMEAKWFLWLVSMNSFQHWGQFLAERNPKEWHQLTHHNGSKYDLAIRRDGKAIVYVTSNGAKNESSSSEIYLLEWNYNEQKWSESRQLTKLGSRIRSPVFGPDGQHILFSSNLNYLGTKRENWASEIFMLNLSAELDQYQLKRLIYNPNGYDAFPSTNEDGSLIVWVSNRWPKNGTDLSNDELQRHDNIFMASLFI